MPAGTKGFMCMLMAVGSSGWAAGATGSRSPVGADGKFGPKVDPRAVSASEEAHVADGNGSSSSPAYCHITRHKNPSQHYGSMLREHWLTRQDEDFRQERHARRRLNLVQHADVMRDGAAAEEERQLHSASKSDEAGSAPAAQP